MTNSKTSICGIYELPRAIAVMETGLTMAKINELLGKFENKYHRIVCSKITNEVIITNWLKYNNNTSPKVQTAIETAFERVKDKDLIRYRYSMDTVSSGMDTVSIARVPVPVNDTVIISSSLQEPKEDEYQTIMDKWNGITGLAHIDCIEHKRLEQVGARLKEKGFEKFLQMIENVKLSPFLLGKVKGKDGKGFKATFDWCICPNNFQKVLDGNYIDNMKNGVEIDWLDDYIKSIDQPNKEEKRA